MKRKIESQTIKIKGTEYTFLKPNAVDMIEIEDRCIGADGAIDEIGYAKRLLELVDRSLKIDDFIKFNGEPVELSSGDKIVIPDTGFDVWNDEVRSIETFSRVKLATIALRLSGVKGEISLHEFKYEDIDSLAMRAYTLYDSSELTKLIEKITSFCL